MKKFLFLIIFFFIAYQCFACMDEPQHIIFSSGKRIDIYRDHKDQSKTKEKLKSTGENLSDEDIDILTDFIARGLSVTEQTEQQYSEKMKQLDLEKCPQWEKIERKAKWTAYIKTNKGWFNGECLGYRC